MHDRRSLRLKHFDYSCPGSYFVTICTHRMNRIFGEVVDGKMVLNELGLIADKYWKEIPGHFNHIELDQYVVMPNHVHGIIHILDDVVGAGHVQPLQNKYQHIIPGSIGSIVRGYKSAVSKWIHSHTFVFTVWQHNYYEHVIQNDHELDRIREYIQYNPFNWQWE